MFEFVNEVIINSAKDALSTLDKFAAYGADGFRILRVGDYKVANIKGSKIYKTEATDPVIATGTLTVPASVIPTVDGDIWHLRLEVDQALSGSAESYFFQSVNDRKQRKIYVNIDVVKGDTVNDIAKKFTDNLKRQANIYQNLRFSVSVTDATITFTGGNEFQRFDKIEIQRLVPWTGAALGNYYPKDPVFATLVTGTSTQPKEGFGTYWTMLKNVQIQTSLRTGLFNQDNDDSKIVPGAKYNQYVFDYECERDITGHGAVGEKLESITKAIFWINTGISASFETVATTAGATIEPAKSTGGTIFRSAPMGGNSGATGSSMSLAVGESKYADITIDDYDEVSSDDINIASVEGTKVTGVAAGSATVTYKKNGSAVLVLSVTVS